MLDCNSLSSGNWIMLFDWNWKFLYAGSKFVLKVSFHYQGIFSQNWQVGAKKATLHVLLHTAILNEKASQYFIQATKERFLSFNE